MIIDNTPQHKALLSNVGEIGEFRIRNSAKAFGILSSGLYANKIRAIIRELSCNAVDSHIAAGRAETPFDLHLPNSLEPHFSIRDYGTGLSHEQVTQIYTTYFESTKTESNDFIGALGLGSKSPFSYTDNFTVTAIQDGRKGIYTAFINSEGVPSIALMAEEDTDEPSGVEIKFAVDDRWDFDKFRQEAKIVYKYFSLRPVVSGYVDFQFEEQEYETKDIIPGVHCYPGSYYDRNSVAVMGNIAYPIDVPNAEKNLGELSALLKCGLEMHFGIGELDFQASREGLSYVPQTIESIKRKLEALNAVLADRLREEVDAIPNLWDRAQLLYKKKNNKLWSAAVIDYAVATKLPTFNCSSYSRLAEFEFTEEHLAEKWNIRIRAVSRTYSAKALSNIRPHNIWKDVDGSGQTVCRTGWTIGVNSSCHFVINDTKNGAGERVRYHYRSIGDTGGRTIWILEKADKNKEMDLTGFFDAIYNPPEDRRFLASDLKQKTRHSVGRNVSVLRLERRNNGGWTQRNDMVWRDAGDTSKFDANETYYYVPLNGFQMESTKGYTSGKELYEDAKSINGLFGNDIYGVRKKDLAEIQQRSNWKLLEEHVAEELAKKDLEPVLLSLVAASLMSDDILRLPEQVTRYLDGNTDYEKFVNKFKGVDKYQGSMCNLKNLLRNFKPANAPDLDDLIQKYQAELDFLNKKYPLLQAISYRAGSCDIAEYINLIDAKEED